MILSIARNSASVTALWFVLISFSLAAISSALVNRVILWGGFSPQSTASQHPFWHKSVVSRSHCVLRCQKNDHCSCAAYVNKMCMLFSTQFFQPEENSANFVTSHSLYIIQKSVDMKCFVSQSEVHTSRAGEDCDLGVKPKLPECQGRNRIYLRFNLSIKISFGSLNVCNKKERDVKTNHWRETKQLFCISQSIFCI